MRKFICLVVAMVAMAGCKSKSATATRLDNKTEVALKGNWKLTNVSYPGSEVIKVTSFDLADSKCFIGSTWRLISTSNKGNFSLNSPSCTAYSTPITWFVNKEGLFVMKILDEAKAKTVKAGYTLTVTAVTENTFQLVDKINVAGKITDVVYQFERLN